jgi:hypothetical protein
LIDWGVKGGPDPENVWVLLQSNLGGRFESRVRDGKNGGEKRRAGISSRPC